VTEPKAKLGFLAKSALSLVTTSFLTSGLGFVYWVVAARFFTPTTIGESGAALAAMNIIAPIAALGFGTVLLAKLPAMTSHRTELLVTAAVVSGLFGGVLALICALALPSAFVGLPGAGNETFATLLFAAGVAAQGVGNLVDSALLSLEGGGPQLWRNATFSVAKLALLVAFALALHRYGSLGIYASWFCANVVSIAAVTFWLARKRGIPIRRMRPTSSALKGLHFTAAQHHALNLALQVPYFAMPIIANVILGSANAGYLYVTWSVAGIVFLVPLALSTALFASGARDATAFFKDFRLSLRASLAACLVANLLIFPLGGIVLRLFGSAYTENGHTVLILLCVAGFGVILKDHHVTIARVTADVGREAMLVWALTICELVGASVGAYRNGMLGLAQGWLLAVVVEAVVFGPLVLRAYRGRLEWTAPVHG
jgi:O-antigen/teichoic acid export membrane protein